MFQCYFFLQFTKHNQAVKVKWNGTLSEAFSIKNGVKQGAVLSAILFCVYIDDLIKELRRNRDGCWINNRFVGITVYADDIVLLSPPLDGLQNKVDTCSTYAKQYHLTFSTNKNPTKSTPQWHHNNKQLQMQDGPRYRRKEGSVYCQEQ